MVADSFSLLFWPIAGLLRVYWGFIGGAIAALPSSALAIRLG